MTQSYYLGVDAGGSHCRARLTDEAGNVLGAGTTGPANARVGAEALRTTLDTAISLALADAGVDAGILPRTHVGMGIAGISRIGVREGLAALDFPFASIAYATDSVIANLGAHGGRDGAILILGTGSIAQIRVGGVDFAIGGYGFPISDEGSGAALGLSAVRHALRALDGRTARTPLSLAVSDRFGHAIPQAIAWMDRAVPRDYAAIAPLVMDYADAGDAIARSIVEDAAQHVERFIETIFERGAPNCALMGGLASRLRHWLRERTVARLIEPEGDALTGALMLAGLKPVDAERAAA